jgi:superfamily II DNA/RNA helicase
VNYECPDDDMTYVHRIGRTGRAGKAGVAVTFVDWRDMHRWKLINDALGLGRPEPVETYSTSEHLYAELDIPREATGTLPRAMRDRAGLEAEAVEDIGETGRIRSPRAKSAALSSGSGSSGSGSSRSGSSGSGSSGSGGRSRRGRSQRDGARSEGARLDGQLAGEPGRQPRTRRRRRTRAGRELGADQQAATEIGGRPAPEAGQPEEVRAEATRRKAS